MGGSLGSLLGPSGVGFMATHFFHYQAITEATEKAAGAPDDAVPPPPKKIVEAERKKNRAALGSAMLWCTVLPWMVQLFVFFPMLHTTYRNDVTKLQAAAVQRSERTLGAAEEAIANV